MPGCRSAGVLRAFAVSLAAVLLSALPAQAQGVTPTSSVALDLDPGPVSIPLGASHEIPFQVKLTLSNLACTQAATATVTLSVKDKPSPLNGVKGMAPATLTFNVPQGNYLSGVPASSPYEQRADATLSINVTTEALANHEHAFEVTGKFDGTLSGCQGAGTIPSAEGSAEHQIKTGPAAAQGAALGATNSQTSPPPSSDGSKGAPGLGAPGLVLLAIVLAALRGRRPG